MAPRLTARKPKLHLPSSAPAQPPAPIGDNGGMGEEAERVTLISFISRLNQTKAACELAKAPFDAAKKAHNQTFKLAAAAIPRFTRKRLEQLMEEMDTPARDMADNVREQTRHRRWLGIVEPEQAELMLGNKAPADVKDDAHWRAEGFKAGLRQLPNKPPSECNTRFHQAFMHEHERGLNQVLMANAPKPMPLTPAQQAAKDFAEDEPTIDVAAEARKLKNNAAFMDRSAPDAEFEASPEELAAQAGRQTEDVV